MLAGGGWAEIPREGETKPQRAPRAGSSLLMWHHYRTKTQPCQTNSVTEREGLILERIDENSGDGNSEDVIPIHEHDLTSFRGIQFIPEPIPRSLGDFASSNNECVVDTNALARLWIEDFVPERYQC